MSAPTTGWSSPLNSRRLKRDGAPAGDSTFSDTAEGEVTAARRNARLYLGGLAASLLGTSAMSLVAGVWVKSLAGSSAQAGLVSACVYAPSLAGPLAGLVADRVHRQRWLVTVNSPRPSASCRCWRSDPRTRSGSSSSR